MESLDRPVPEVALVSIQGHDYLVAAKRQTAITYKKYRRARRYRLYLAIDGSPQVTLPWSGSMEKARAFVREHSVWLAARIERFHQEKSLRLWQNGSDILFRGELIRISLAEENGQSVVRAGHLIFSLPKRELNLQAALQNKMRQLAAAELPARLAKFADKHQIFPKKVRIGNQTSRWGSASKRGTICLNWRLIQMPDRVADYVMLHELMHLREMNHSSRFWALIASSCPDYEDSRRWLRKNNLRLQ